VTKGDFPSGRVWHRGGGRSLSNFSLFTPLRFAGERGDFSGRNELRRGVFSLFSWRFLSPFSEVAALFFMCPPFRSSKAAPHRVVPRVGRSFSRESGHIPLSVEGAASDPCEDFRSFRGRSVSIHANKVLLGRISKLGLINKVMFPSGPRLRLLLVHSTSLSPVSFTFGWATHVVSRPGMFQASYHHFSISSDDISRAVNISNFLCFQMSFPDYL